VHLSTLPVSFGLLAFVFAGHAVFPAIYTSMEKPEEYPAMLDKARSRLLRRGLHFPSFVTLRPGSLPRFRSSRHAAMPHDSDD
jgi:hypothetical protein